jgi:hypothetical protein
VRVAVKSLQGVKPMGDDPMALLGLEGALKHYYYLLLSHAMLMWHGHVMCPDACCS